MDGKICDERHERIDTRLKEHDVILKEQSNEIAELKTNAAVNTTEIKNLIKSMSGLTKAMWALVTIIGSSLVGFFIYAVQNAAFK